MRIATLPWYDLHEVRDAHDRLWSAIAAQLRSVGVAAVPETLDRTRRYDAGWHEPELLLGQACGYDTVLEQPPPLRIVATPHFDFAGCDGPNYRSFVVVPARSDMHTLVDLRGKRCVINNATSHSGMNGLRAMVAPLHERGRFFSRVLVSGAHEASIALLGRGEADVAAIDCVTYGLLQRHRPRAVAELRIIDHTQPVPGPPYVTSVATPPEIATALQHALRTVIAALAPDVRAALGVCGVSTLALDDYEPIVALARRADAHGYRELGATHQVRAQRRRTPIADHPKHPAKNL